ncbi:MAG: ABC transporter permease [Thaumarchaeota archaeon]|nr:ABC transporter permease [Nitrososphaerota archaeon]
MIVEIAYLARRDLKKFWKSKLSLLSTLIRPLSWLVLFGLAFNPAKIVGGSSASSNLTQTLGGAPDYFSFIATGMLSIMVLQLSLRGMSSMVIDRYLGFLDKVMVAPIRRETMLLSKMTSTAVRGVIQALVLLIVALPLGMKIGSNFGILQLLGVLVVLVVLSISLSGLFISIGAMVKTFETQEAVASALALPIMFTSNVLYPTRSMPFWLQPIALINPITYSSSIIRSLLYSPNLDLSSLALDTGLLALLLGASIAVVYVAAAVMSSRK